MYSIDVNFLSDRKLDSSATGTVVKRKKETPLSEKMPIFIGAGVGVALIAISGGALWFFKSQTATTQSAITKLEADIQRLEGQNAEVKKIQAEIDAIQAEMNIFVNVFNSIKPWSALLIEISEIAPSNVQVKSISQGEGKSLTISGIGKSYGDVNDFVLTLKKSPFFDPEKTKLTSSSQIDHPNELELPEGGTGKGNQNAMNINQPTNNTKDSKEPTGPTIELPKVIDYTISTDLSDVQADKLITLLKNRGAIGLVSRMNTLKQKGAIQP